MSITMPSLTPAQINFAETAQWKEILRQALANLRVAIPAIVQSFDAANQTVTVQIAIREVVRMPNGPQNTAIAPLQSVPVCFPSAGGFSLTLPVAAGDEGLLLFCDSCISLWWNRGGVQNQLERRRHDLTDCGFYPGGRSLPRALSAYPADSARLTKDDGSAYVEITGGGAVNVLAPAGLNITGDVTIDGSILSVEEGTFNSIPVSTHLHTGVTTGGGNTGGPIP